jgi:hypothetical protein
LAAPRAYAADRVRGGYARPFDGPQVWSAAGPSGAVTAEWDSPRELSRVELVFNDDPNTCLVPLMHRIPAEPLVTPELVIADLVLRYRLDARVDGVWQELVTISDNRMRHRAHTFSSVQADALRLVITATNGSPWATVFALRAYSDPDPRLLHSGPPRIAPLPEGAG